MKKSISSVVLLLVLLAFNACQKSEKTEKDSDLLEQVENKGQKMVTESNSKKDKLEPNNYLADITKIPFTDSTRFALMDGILLKANEDTLSATIKTIALGSRLELIRETKVNQEKGFLRGKILKVSHEGQKGFVFSGALSTYPIPSFAKERSFFQEGDYRKYVEELQNLGFRAECKNEKCSGIYFPKIKDHEAFLLQKLLTPSLLKEVQLTRAQIAEDFDSENGEFIQSPEGREHKERKWGPESTLYLRNYMDSVDQSLIIYHLYYVGDDAQADVIIEKAEGGYILGHGETN